MSKTFATTVTLFAAAAFAALFAMHGEDTRSVCASGFDPTCPQTADPTTQTGQLETFAGDGSGGVIWNGSASLLELKKEGGLFQSTTLPVTDQFNVAAAGDFDEDGWTDMVVSQSGNAFIRFFKNRTYENPEPDWNDPNDVRAPKFVRTVDIEPSGSMSGHTGMVSADFDGDGHLDFFIYRNSGDNTSIDSQLIYRGNGNGTFKTPYAAALNPADLGFFNWSSTNATVTDWNNDGWPDVLFGNKQSSSNSSGAVVALLNNCPDPATNPITQCSQAPRFTKVDVLTGLNLGNRGANAVTYADFTGDGVGDLVVGSPSCCSTATERLRMWPGVAGGGFAAPQAITSVGAFTVALAADFSLDGAIDLVVGTDEWNYGSHLGGQAYFYKNQGGATPLTTVTTQLTTHQSHGAGNLYDFDLGVALDYDQDPSNTPDIIVADGNNSGTFFVLANRVVSQYVQCGEVASGVLDLGDLQDEEMVVTAARLSPTMTIPSGTSITFYMTNEDPANWQVASPCTDDPSDFCVTFPNSVGRDVAWKAEMCSDTARTSTPDISEMSVTFDYTPARVHYRAGVVVSDGVAYAGAFRQPGDRGHFYASNAGLTTTYWDAAAKLDAMSDSARKIYTSKTNGKTQIEFSVGNAANTDLIATLNVASSAQAGDVIAWQRSKRFGIGGITQLSRLGAVETSSAAVIGPPSRPVWYSNATAADKAVVDAFISGNADRPTLVLFGSKDAALHAVYSDPDDITATQNGKEAWAFVPAKVAYNLVADKTSGTISSFPDGSPTVADVRFSDGTMHTVAVVGGGNGAKSVFALDVTNTVTSGGTVTGPTPLWHKTPGGNNAGRSYTKPVIARVKIADVERHIAIIGTGVAADNPTPPYTKGRVVFGVDIQTGARLWKFKAACPITSDLVTFETDDDLEPGTPALDGFIDRVAMADACGYVYKFNPAVDMSGDHVDTTPYASIDTNTNAGGMDVMAIFATTTTSPLNDTRPIAGTIGVRPDSTGRVVFFFGTGGIESYDPSKLNAFYAVYADNGTVRHTLTGTCTNGQCEKYYGGVVVSEDAVYTTRAIDPVVGSGSCDTGTSFLAGLDLDDLSTNFDAAIGSATVSSLFGSAGAIYAATLGGEIVRVGTPTQEEPGSGGGGNSGGTPNAEMQILGWRTVQR